MEIEPWGSFVSTAGHRFHNPLNVPDIPRRQCYLPVLSDIHGKKEFRAAIGNPGT